MYLAAQKKQNTVQSLHHKKHEGITLINFKKITSVVVFSCAKKTKYDVKSTLQNNKGYHFDQFQKSNKYSCNA